MERVKSIFRRNTEKGRRGSGPYVTVVGPNGLLYEQPLRDQQPLRAGDRPHSHDGLRSHAHDAQHPPAHEAQHPRAHDPQHPHAHDGHHPHAHPHQHPHQHPHGGTPTHQQPPPTQPTKLPPQPGDGSGATTGGPSATATGQLQIHLYNDTSSSNVYAYITGQAINQGNALFLLSADGHTPYYPGSPSSTNQRLTQNVSIPLGAPGNTVYCTIPQLAGGRIWFSIGAPLVFAVNPGPGLVEPSIFNQSDPNVGTTFGFAEFTFNSAQVFANISYVDFVGLPIALTLTDTSGTTQHVSGIPANGLQTIANGLRQQTAQDGQRWSSLIVNSSNGQLLRILSPNSGILLNPSWFANYYANYVNQVYGKYTGQNLIVDTQAQWGDVNGVSNGSGISFGAGGNFTKPTTGDIFSCASGPFATGQNAETNTIIPRLAAAFNRSTLLLTNSIPDGAGPSQYYQNSVTNHYARIVHSANLDGMGYAFPYDDVTPTGGVPQEGAVFSYAPTLLLVSVGGNHAYA